jgi:hypothetical protein
MESESGAAAHNHLPAELVDNTGARCEVIPVRVEVTARFPPAPADYKPPRSSPTPATRPFNAPSAGLPRSIEA